MKTTREIAEICGVSEQAVRAWCRKNHIAKDAKGSFAISET
ncbi:helix-turn-helix domain-containing protein, partial [[Ruminococcus] gnavus]|nr:helix-turn-helix domain-containing protein [Mediterraneibacter gnavus]